MASARYSGDSVQKVMTVSGTHDTPIDTPCRTLHSISVVMSTLRSKLISQKPVVDLQQRADRQADARIEPRHRHRRKEADRRAQPARADDLADGRLRVAGMLLQQRRQQHDQRRS